jgi:hypothetical protein
MSIRSNSLWQLKQRKEFITNRFCRCARDLLSDYAAGQAVEGVNLLGQSGR